MASKRTAKKKSTRAKQQPQKEGAIVDIVAAEEPWSEYTLSDGTSLRLRPVIAEVRRTNEYNEDGDPVYQAKSTIVVSARIPRRLKKKSRSAKKSKKK